MAIRRCRECGSRVSTEAVSCPKCGVPEPTPKRESASSFEKRVLAVAAVIGAVLLLVMVASQSGPTIATAPSAATSSSDDSSSSLPAADAPDHHRIDFVLPTYLRAGSTICTSFPELKAMVEGAPADCTTIQGAVQIYQVSSRLIGFMGQEGMGVQFRAVTKTGEPVEAFALMRDV